MAPWIKSEQRPPTNSLYSEYQIRNPMEKLACDHFNYSDRKLTDLKKSCKGSQLPLMLKGLSLETL